MKRSSHKSSPRFVPFVERLEDRAVPATLVVNTAVDVVDPNDNLLSLREAINAANMPGADTIAFGIGSGAKTLNLATNLPDVTDATVIDATTQPGYAGKPLIELRGVGATAGLRLLGGSSTVRGFAMNRFTSNLGPTGGIVLAGVGGHVVEDNYIGTNLAGTGVFNAGQRISYGIILRTDGNTIRDNVISGNGGGGILVQKVAGNASNNVIANNFLGTDWTGSVDLGNTRWGVFFINGGDNNRIEGNVISGNDEGGVIIDGDSNVVVGNKIGVAANGTTPLSNGLNIWIAGGDNNTVGGTAASQGNVIANGKSSGVAVTVDAAGGVPTGNAIRGNSIYANALLGIDLYPLGVTPNDFGDNDSGPNGLQNFPALNAASQTAPGVLSLSVSLHSHVLTAYAVDFYASAAADGSGHGEGQRYLGSATLVTDVFGNATMNVVLSATVQPGEFLTATATDPAGNTSEFSDAIVVTGSGAAAASAMSWESATRFSTASPTVDSTATATAMPVSTWPPAVGDEDLSADAVDAWMSDHSDGDLETDWLDDLVTATTDDFGWK